MSVTAVSAISLGPDLAGQQSGTRQDLNSSPETLSTGNVATAQPALNQIQQTQIQQNPAQQNVQSTQLPPSGVILDPTINPQAAMREDILALQAALESGNLAAAQAASIRIEQDSQEIASAQQAALKRTGSQATSTLSGYEENAMPGSGGAEVDQGNLIDVLA